MDLREKKTRRAIRNAFLQLRSKKPLERITVKELSELAEISKATFYLHYRDMFDLSSQLQSEVVNDILNSVIEQDVSLFDMTQMPRKLSEAFYSHQSLIDILFSGNQAAVLSNSIEQGVRECVFRARPDARSDARFQILLSYQIQGGYYAYMENQKEFGHEQVLKVLDEISSLFNKNMQ